MDRPLDLLLVEDDATDARQLELALGRARGARFRIRWVQSARQAEEFLAGCLPDVIALDLSLPDTGGEETWQRVHRAAAGVPVVVMTGCEDEGLALRLIESGAQDYLIKSSLSPEDLARCFRYAILRGEADRELEEARRAAEQAAQARSAFVAAMSHEIRTPLNAILGLGDLLLDTPLRDDQRQYVETLRRAGRGLLDLLNNVLELSRLESGAFEVAREEFDPRQLVEDTCEMFAFAAHKKRIGLVTEIDADVPRRVSGDAPRLRQVLLNLIGNAVKFTETGRIEVELAATGPGELVLRVADTGPGIPEDRLQAIFERFTQASAQVFGRHGGSGLGLALARELTERMGGRLAATNRPEGGALFSARLPLPAVESGAPGPETARLDGMRVLVLEDDPVERDHYAAWLTRAGAEVVACADAAEAMRLAEAGPLDAALLDSRLSGSGGLELAEAWHRDGRGPARVVVALMTNHRASDVARCQAVGTLALLKPLRADGLLRALATGRRDPEAAAPAEKLRLDGLQLLLAEDNPDNRDLVQAFVAGSGAEIDWVGDGRAAFEARQRQDYDLVLMDVTMPVMDGHEATRRIRSWEREAGAQRAPVVILTAHASREAQRQSRRSGADGHLVKPFDRRALLEAIRAHLASAPAETAGPGGAPADPDISDLVPGYLARRREDVAALGEALGEGRFDTVRGLGHRMKGSGGGYGFPRISELGAALERAGAASDGAAAARATEELAALLDGLDQEAAATAPERSPSR